MAAAQRAIQLKTKEKSNTHILRKKLDRVQLAVFFFCLISYVYVTWKYTHNQLEKDTTTQLIFLIICPLAFIDGWFALQSGQSWARGVRISREETPLLFGINVVTSFILSATSLFLVAYYTLKAP